MSELDTNPEALVEQGLQLYSQGRLDEALEKWHAALAISPEHTRAREYLRYVEDNRTALEESFRLARGSAGGDRPSQGATQQAPITSRTRTMEIEEIDEIGAIEIEEEAPEAAGAAKGFQGAAGGNEALTRKMNLLSKDPPTEDEYTPRIDLAELQERVDESRRRQSSSEVQSVGQQVAEGEDLEEVAKRSAAPTPARLTASVAKENRPRKETPLTVIEGGGERRDEFDPADLTPVKSFLPEPSRLLRSSNQIEDVPGHDRLAPAPQSSVSDRTPAPSTLGLASVGNPAEAVTRRLTPVPSSASDATNSGQPVKADKKSSATPARGFYSDPRNSEVDLPGPLTPTGSVQGGQQEGMLSGARQLFEQGTYEGSLWLCQRVLTSDPEQAEAKELLQQNRKILLEQYRQEIGDFSRVPVVLVPQHEIVWHKLDHRAGFLLSRIDGMLTYEDLLDVSSMEEFEACRILAQLRGQGIIGSQS